MDSTTIAGIMGLVGAVIGGVAGYFGGVRGAQQSFELMRNREEDTAKLRLGKLLDFTCYNVRKINANLYSELPGIDTMLYDTEWPKLIASVRCLSVDEMDNVITWLTGIQKLAYRAQRGEKVHSNDVPPDHLNPNNQAIIDGIVKRLLG